MAVCSGDESIQVVTVKMIVNVKGHGAVLNFLEAVPDKKLQQVRILNGFEAIKHVVAKDHTPSSEGGGFETFGIGQVELQRLGLSEPLVVSFQLIFNFS